MATKIITGKCRAAYAKIMSPVRNDLNGKEEYSVMLLIPKSDASTISEIKSACKEAIASKWPAAVPKGLRNPLKDGDTETRLDGSAMGPEFVDHYFMNVKSDASRHTPEIVDSKGRKLISSDDVVSGDYIRASINAYAYDAGSNRGVAFGLNNVQLVEKGQPLGAGKQTAAQEFGLTSTPAAAAESDSDSDWA